MKSVMPWTSFVKLESAAIAAGDSLIGQAAAAASKEEYHEAVEAIAKTISDHNFSRAAAATALSFCLCAVATEVIAAAVERIAKSGVET